MTAQSTLQKTVGSEQGDRIDNRPGRVNLSKEHCRGSRVSACPQDSAEINRPLQGRSNKVLTVSLCGGRVFETHFIVIIIPLMLLHRLKYIQGRG